MAYTHGQLKAVFNAVLDQPLHARAAYLSSLALQPDLERGVEALLAAHDEAASFLKTSPGDPDEHAPTVLARGTSLGRYIVSDLIGRGGMGDVYCAADTALSRDVAVKVLSPSMTNELGLRRFKQEAKAVAALNHPGIVTIHDVGTMVSVDGSDRTFLVTELLDGETVRERLTGARGSTTDAPGVLDQRLAVDLALQTAQALGAAHSAGIVHRDIKPENLFITSSGRLKILDFGLAKISARSAGSDGPSTAYGTIVGTVGYMAPEQLRGQTVDARTDLFALGAVLYEMLTGRRAFPLESFGRTATAFLKDEPPSTFSDGRSLDPALADIVRRCLEKDSDKRYQSAAAVSTALEAVAAKERRRRPFHLLRPSSWQLPDWWR